MSEKEEGVGQTGTEGFSAPGSKYSLGQVGPSAELWLPYLTVMIRVHTSHGYCVSKMLSPPPSR